MRSFFIATGLVLVSTLPANAALMGTGLAFQQGISIDVCYYNNIGNTSVTFSYSRVKQENNGILPEATDNCTVLLPGGSCRTVSTAVSFANGLWCEANVDNKANLRGRLELRNSSGATIGTETAR